MSSTFSQTMIAEQVEAHTAGGGRAIVFFGGHKITVGPGSKIDGQLLHGVVGDDGGAIVIEVAAITAAQMLPSAQERQIGFGAP